MVASLFGGAAFSIWCKNGVLVPVQQGLRTVPVDTNVWRHLFRMARPNIERFGATSERASEEQALNNPSGLSFIHSGNRLFASTRRQLLK
jgi:hypothetical protein